MHVRRPLLLSHPTHAMPPLVGSTQRALGAPVAFFVLLVAGAVAPGCKGGDKATTGDGKSSGAAKADAKGGPSPQPPVKEASPTADGKAAAPAAAAVDPAALLAKAQGLFKPLPADFADATHPITAEKVKLGRHLYHDARLSKNHDLACATCHDVASFGIDPRPGATSLGHKGQRGGRNTPTSFNAALQFAQFWDGRAADVEAQAKGPVLNPIEMAMPSEAKVAAVLKSIPGYAELFKAAFPGEKDPITYDTMAQAIGAFERTLVTPSPFDRYLGGQADALTPAQAHGLSRFIDLGCVSCHVGVGVGGGMYQKLGLIKPYETKDPGRFEVTHNEADRGVFKVPMLRNVTKTAPYFHDGSIATLPEAIRIMAEHQTPAGSISDADVTAIATFLEALTGEAPKDVSAPEPLASGPKTPAPDPS